jgi:hypothetical protein
MLMRNLSLMIVATLATATLHAAPTRCELRAPDSAPQRVELYTSEGCSSCPPADRWLSALTARDDRLLLAFHVDYWDDLGWPDRFADARFSRRQRDLAQRQRSRSVYTPEVTLEGSEFRGWRSQLPEPMAAAAPSLLARVALDDRLRVDLQPGRGFPADAIAYLAITEDGLYTVVKAGENRGSKLRHDHVVRAYAEPGPLSRSLSLTLPAGLDPAQSRLNLWVEDSAGRTLQALSRPLAACTTPPTTP